jgi:hypothetical protein
MTCVWIFCFSVEQCGFFRITIILIASITSRFYGVFSLQQLNIYRKAQERDSFISLSNAYQATSLLQQDFRILFISFHT